ncbi:nucleotide disphospho-sugar-binding domain-containing protein, partial [Streptomyces niveus]
PQLAILRKADAFITHAGAGGSQEGLATGTPMLAIPLAVDQFGNADTLVQLGVARRLPMEDVTAEALREAVTALVADPEVARRGEEIKQDMAKEGGTHQAADIIESALPAYTA